MLLGLHTDFSGGRSDGLVFPSLEEISTVHCDPHSQKLYVVYESEVNVVLELSCFFYVPVDVGNLISDFSDFSKSRLEHLKVLTSHMYC